MKKEDLFDTLGDINNQYIKEAHMNNKRKNNFAWVKCAAEVHQKRGRQRECQQLTRFLPA